MPPTTKKLSTQPDHRSHPYSKKSTSIDMTSPTSPNPARSTASPWNLEDDTQLVQARNQGMNWEPIAKQYFPTKTANACRKRHERLINKRHNTEEWDPAKFDALAVAYLQLREQMWKILADKVGEKWQIVESKCMEKGLKNLTSTARSAPRRGNQLETPHNQYELDDSGFVDEPPQADPCSASSASHSRSSRRTASVSSYPATPQLQYASSSGLPVPQPMYQSIQQHYQHYQPQHQNQHSIPSIASLLASTSDPNPNTIVTTN